MRFIAAIVACVFFASALPAIACDPKADERAMNELMKGRNFNEAQMQQFLDKFMPLSEEISKAIDANDNDTACSKIGEALELARNFEPN